MDTQSEDANFPLHNWVSPTKLLALKDWYQISDPLIKGISPWILGIAFWGVGLLVSENERSLNMILKMVLWKSRLRL